MQGGILEETLEGKKDLNGKTGESHKNSGV